MDPVFHIDLQALLTRLGPLALELGCGQKAHPGRVGIDRLELPGVDIVADLEQGLPFLPDNSVDSVHTESFLEHVQQLDHLMGEIWRVLKPKGRLHLFVPHFSNPFFYSDYTHQRFFGLYSFEYFSKSQGRYHRRVPDFYHSFSFHTLELRLNIGTGSRNPLKWAAHWIFNIHPRLQELYEGNFCYWVPCYGISAVLEAEKNG